MGMLDRENSDKKDKDKDKDKGSNSGSGNRSSSGSNSSYNSSSSSRGTYSPSSSFGSGNNSGSNKYDRPDTDKVSRSGSTGSSRSRSSDTGGTSNNSGSNRYDRPSDNSTSKSKNVSTPDSSGSERFREEVRGLLDRGSGSGRGQSGGGDVDPVIPVRMSDALRLFQQAGSPRPADRPANRTPSRFDDPSPGGNPTWEWMQDWAAIQDSGKPVSSRSIDNRRPVNDAERSIGANKVDKLFADARVILPTDTPFKRIGKDSNKSLDKDKRSKADDVGTGASWEWLQDWSAIQDTGKPVQPVVIANTDDGPGMMPEGGVQTYDGSGNLVTDFWTDLTEQNRVNVDKRRAEGLPVWSPAEAWDDLMRQNRENVEKRRTAGLPVWPSEDVADSGLFGPPQDTKRDFLVRSPRGLTPPGTGFSTEELQAIRKVPDTWLSGFTDTGDRLLPDPDYAEASKRLASTLPADTPFGDVANQPLPRKRPNHDPVAALIDNTGVPFPAARELGEVARNRAGTAGIVGEGGGVTVVDTPGSSDTVVMATSPEYLTEVPADLSGKAAVNEKGEVVAKKEPSIWDRAVKGAGEILGHTMIGGVVNALFPELGQGIERDFLAMDDNMRSGRPGTYSQPGQDTLPRNGALYDLKGDSDNAKDKYGNWKPGYGPSNDYSAYEAALKPKTVTSVDGGVVPVFNPGKTGTGVPGDFDGDGYPDEWYTGPRRVVFPDMKTYKPGRDGEWMYFRGPHYLNGGVVGYAEGGMINDVSGREIASVVGDLDPRAEIVEDAEMALRGQHPHPQIAIEAFVNLFGEPALRQLQATIEAEQVSDPTSARLIAGPGGPEEDAVPAVIDDTHEARLSSGEVVMTADAVKNAGDGDPMAGAERLMQLDAALRGARPGRGVKVERVS